MKTEKDIKLYRTWKRVRYKCRNAGIRFNKEWDNYYLFQSWAFDNKYKHKLILWRINEDLEYSSTNCKWITRSEASTIISKTHGMAHSKIYKIWKSMRNRCFSPNTKNYKWYGGRGISVCTDWKNSFELFYGWATDNGYEEGLSIERINVDGNYCVENCCWIPKNQQHLNKRVATRRAK